MSDEQQVNDCQAVFDRVRALGHTDPRVHMAFGHLARGMPADQVHEHQRDPRSGAGAHAKLSGDRP